MKRPTFATAMLTFAGAFGTVSTLASSVAMAQGWVTFSNQTSTRLVAASGLGSADPEEKDFAYADLDKDGDIDLICVRKQPFTVPNGKRNVLFMNENGVLVDRTNEYATSADDGGQGFLDITNDRDVAIGDFNNDGWLDFVTAPALNQDLPKTISHPRVYMNLGNNGNGQWQGFKYEQARIPLMNPAPNACGIAVGDVTNDGFPDIYITTYFQGLSDRLLVNDGTGVFLDQTLTRMTATMVSSGFGTAAAIVDMNGDGTPDVVRSENGPFKATYNNPAQVGFFNKHETASAGAHYGMNVGDLNNDGKMDVVVGDDGSDRYLLNIGNGADGMANFESKTFSFIAGGDDGFGNNIRIVDLNNDGFRDVLISDVDVDIGGCGRRLHLYRNLGNVPSVTLQDQGTGGMPESELTGTHDTAVFDLNGDGWNDLIVGRCAGIRVFINQPPVGLAVSYPNGLPGYVTPNQTTVFTVKLNPTGGATVQSGTETITYTTVDNGLQTANLSPLGDNLYQATLPAVACTETIQWWVSAKLVGSNNAINDPPGAPATSYTSLAALGTDIVYREEFEAGTDGWTVTNVPALTAGFWIAVNPNGTVVGGQQAAPEDDATSGDATIAFVTQNGTVGGAPSISDVDGGPTILTSPKINALGGDALVSFAAWFFCDDFGTNPTQADTLLVEVSNDDGLTWTTVYSIGTTNSAWKQFLFRVSDYVDPTDDVRVRFTTQDVPNNSTTEAGIDNFQVELIVCPAECPSDLNGDSNVDGADLAQILGSWGQKGAPGFPGDLSNDGVIDGSDLAFVLGAWGPCS